MQSRSETITAPYAVLESRRSGRPALAVVFGRESHPRDELLVTIEPATGEAQLALHCREFEGEGIGSAVVRRPNDRTCRVTVKGLVRGFNRRTEMGETVEVSLAATWSLTRTHRDAGLDVVGTALAFRSGEGTTVELQALRGHEFNRLDVDTADEPTARPDAGVGEPRRARAAVSTVVRRLRPDWQPGGRPGLRRRVTAGSAPQSDAA